MTRLGLTNIRLQIAASAVGALALSAYLAVTLNEMVIVPLVGVGLLLGAAYSVPPVRLKGRGVLQLLCLWMIIFVGPMILMSLLVAGRSWPAELALAASYGATQMGVILVNTAEDFVEDESMGVRTIIVALGIQRGLRLADWQTRVAGASLVAVLGAWGLVWGAPPIGLLALVPLAFVLVHVEHAPAHLSIAQAKRTSGQSRPPYTPAARGVPMWIAGVAWSSLGAALVLRLLA